MMQAWTRFFFRPAAPTDLALGRVVFFASLFVWYAPYDFAAWADVTDILWTPVWLFRGLHLPLFSAAVIDMMQLCWKLSLLLSCLGLFTRASTMVACVLSAYLLALSHSFGKVHHMDQFLVFVIGILALSRAGDAFSLDARLRARRGEAAPAHSSEYRWPIQLIRALLALIFFAAVCSKLRTCGIEWFFSDNLSNLFIQHAYLGLYPGGPFSGFLPYVAQFGWLCRMLAIFTLIFQLGCPLMLVSRTARALLMPVMVGFLLVDVLFLVSIFWTIIFCHAFWVPWENIKQRFSSMRRRYFQLSAEGDSGDRLAG